MRLQTGIAALDLTKHAMACIPVRSDGPVCSVLGFATVLLFHSYIFLNLCIAINLHLVILRSLRPRRRWELYYWALSLGLPILLDVPLLGSHSPDC